jgi:hypothetical protein
MDRSKRRTLVEIRTLAETGMGATSNWMKIGAEARFYTATSEGTRPAQQNWAKSESMKQFTQTQPRSGGIH